MSQTRTQRYAGRAMARVILVAQNKAISKEYKTRADSFPAMVMQSGLAQALGFLRAKSEEQSAEKVERSKHKNNAKDADKKPEENAKKNRVEAYRAYAADIAKVLDDAGSAKALHEQSITAELPQYRRLTREVLEVAILIRRFAQIELHDDDQPPTEAANEHPTA